MIHKHLNYYKAHIKDDIPASISVFLVALPLCLGIAMASGAPLFAGLISGIVGGLVVSLLSGSQLSVSGPAAGLTVIILSAIETLGGFAPFLLAVVLAGIIQLIMGYLKAGVIGAFFPSSVIKAMLSAIGIILIMKQIPHAIGYDVSFEGDDSYMLESASSTLSELFNSFGNISVGSMVIALLSLSVLIFWDTKKIKEHKTLTKIPASLIVVVLGVVLNAIFIAIIPSIAIGTKHLVSLPILTNMGDFKNLFLFPDFSFITNPKIYTIAFTLAIVASLETLLSLEAVSKIDPLKHIAPTNQELKAQGVGNIISGFIGGLPITAVIVRSSANVQAGGVTRISSFLHGFWLLLSVLFLASYLNHIPLSALSAILLYIGYKLTNPKQFISIYKEGMVQFLPFIITIGMIIMTDLLQGIIMGVIVGLFFVIRSNYHYAITLKREGDKYFLNFNKDVSFLSKAHLRDLLLSIEEDSTLLIDCTRAQFIDHDIMELLQDFIKSAPDDNITIDKRSYENMH